MKLKKVRGYIFSRSFMGERVPQHIQNIVINDYCTKNDLHLLLSATEYCMDKSISIFKSVFDEVSKVSGIVFYSIFQLPENDIARTSFLKKAINKKKIIYFACEREKIFNNSHLEKINNIWMIKKELKKCHMYKK